MRAVYAVSLHGCQQIAAHGVAAQAAGPAHLQAQPGQADGNIGFRTGSALVEHLRVFDGAGPVGNQQQHRFAKCHDIQRGSQRLLHA
jgi:hypothetical protein